MRFGLLAALASHLTIRETDDVMQAVGRSRRNGISLNHECHVKYKFDEDFTDSLSACQGAEHFELIPFSD